MRALKALLRWIVAHPMQLVLGLASLAYAVMRFRVFRAEDKLAEMEVEDRKRKLDQLLEPKKKIIAEAEALRVETMEVLRQLEARDQGLAVDGKAAYKRRKALLRKMRDDPRWR